MVDLRVDGRVAGGEPADDVDLPERTTAVQWTRVQPRDLLGQLGAITGGRQRQLADMEVEIEVCVVDPVGVVGTEWHLDQSPAQRGQQVQPRGDEVLHLRTGQPAVGRCARVVDGEPGHVPGLPRVFQREELRVEAGELPHAGSVRITRRRVSGR